MNFLEIRIEIVGLSFITNFNGPLVYCRHFQTDQIPYCEMCSCEVVLYCFGDELEKMEMQWRCWTGKCIAIRSVSTSA